MLLLVLSALGRSEAMPGRQSASPEENNYA